VVLLYCVDVDVHVPHVPIAPVGLEAQDQRVGSQSTQTCSLEGQHRLPTTPHPTHPADQGALQKICVMTLSPDVDLHNNGVCRIVCVWVAVAQEVRAGLAKQDGCWFDPQAPPS